MLSRCILLFAVYIYISEVSFLTVVSNVIVSTLSITSQMNGNSAVWPGVIYEWNQGGDDIDIVYYCAKETNEKHEF